MDAQKLHRQTLITVSLFWLFIMACSFSMPISPTKVPEPIGSIIYSSDESGNFEIYHMNVTNGLRNRLTDNTSDDTSPFYFPPGRFGFVSDKTSKYQIYTMKIDGSDQRLWKEDEKRSFFAPRLSPDRKQLAYVSQSNNSNSSLHVSNLDGSQDKTLTKLSGLYWDPSWSPDGKKIAYASSLAGDWEIHIIDTEDGKISRLTDNQFYDGRPIWSPDGHQILFESDRDGDWEIYVMDVDGGNVRPITENSTGDWLANWSPDGQWIAYVSNRDGDDEIYIVGIDGKHQIKLTNNTAQDRYPAWVP
jgi:Tol biopolymer transport system component